MQNVKEWNEKNKDWTIKLYILNKKDISYVILPPSTTTIENTEICGTEQPDFWRLCPTQFCEGLYQCRK